MNAAGMVNLCPPLKNTERMRYIMTEDEATYMEAYQGHFSRKLASWAIDNMDMKDPSTDKIKPVSKRSVDDVIELLSTNGVKIPDECTFDAWYLYHMSIADYPKTLSTDKARSTFVEETIFDPDGDPTNILACFTAKMCNAGKVIHWGLFL